MGGNGPAILSAAASQERKTTVTLSFEAHIPMGLNVKPDGNEVIRVKPEGQAAKLGVKKGWRIEGLDGKPIPSNIKSAEFLGVIQEATNSLGYAWAKFRVTFDTTALNA